MTWMAQFDCIIHPWCAHTNYSIYLIRKTTFCSMFAFVAFIFIYFLISSLSVCVCFVFSIFFFLLLVVIFKWKCDECVRWQNGNVMRAVIRLCPTIVCGCGGEREREKTDENASQ